MLNELFKLVVNGTVKTCTNEKCFHELSRKIITENWKSKFRLYFDEADEKIGDSFRKTRHTPLLLPIFVICDPHCFSAKLIVCRYFAL